jgi:arylsulfatase A-like enzyme
MSENGSFIDLKGDSSDIIVREALKFIEEKSKESQPFFTVIWDGSPHDPFLASDEDRKKFQHLDESSQNHYGELVAFDRSLGLLRKRLQELDLADNTLIWYCSDNGGLSKIKPNTVGGLRGSKGTVYEGGLRVPGIIEWPAVIDPKISRFPASTMDIFPTIVDILGLPKDNLLNPIDGISLMPIFHNEIGKRIKKIPFRYKDQGVLLDNNYKLIATSVKENEFVLFNLENDPIEAQNIAQEKPILFDQMKTEFKKWNQTVESSMLGKDYPEGKVLKNPKSHFWMKDDRYKPFLEEWSKRPEYRDRILRGK